MQVYNREKKRHMFGYEAAWTAQSFAYEVKGDSAVILRCFSRDVKAEIPEQIEGCPVTEIGAYAFSAHFEEEKLEKEILAGRVKLYVPEMLNADFVCGKEVSVLEGDAAGQRDRNKPSQGQDGDRSGKTAFPSALCGERSGQITFPPALRGDSSGKVAFPPALCGDRLEEIVLPVTIRRVGRYCFYNCGNLRRIEFHGELSDWGSGAFTGCHGVRSLRVYTDADGRTHLKDVLDELREELEVEYFTGVADRSWLEGQPESTADEETMMEHRKESGNEDRTVETVLYGQGWEQIGNHSESGFARLIFPEFYEEGVENTPARILENHVHGSGILYRNCFRGRALDFAQYDALFPHAKAWESGELVLRMALARLRAGKGLTQKAKEQYEQYLTEHAAEAGRWLLGQKDLEGVRFLLRLAERNGNDGDSAGNGGRKDGVVGRTDGKTPGILGKTDGRMTGVPGQTDQRTPGALVQTLLKEASRMQYMEAVSFLMEYGHADRAERPARRRRLEL